MTVYIEYAFMENFLFDGVLLYLSLKWSRGSIRWKKIIFSASIGSIFALVYPLLSLPVFLGYTLKFFIGALLCLLVAPSIKTKKDRDRYVLSLVYFLFLSFFFGGALTAALQEIFPQKTPIEWIMLGFILLAAFSFAFIEKLHKKREVDGFLYDCVLFVGDRKIQTQGFLDSGNLARKNNLPICFLSPDIFYELFGEEILKGEGQVRDEIAVSTVGGVKTYPLYQGEIELNVRKYRTKKQVYFTVFSNMLSRDYKVILATALLEE